MTDYTNDFEWLDRIARISNKYSTRDVPVAVEIEPGVLLGVDLDNLPYAFDGLTKKWKRIGLG